PRPEATGSSTTRATPTPSRSRCSPNPAVRTWKSRRVRSTKRSPHSLGTTRNCGTAAKWRRERKGPGNESHLSRNRASPGGPRCHDDVLSGAPARVHVHYLRVRQSVESGLYDGIYSW